MITTQLKQQVAADCFKRGDIEACGFIVDGTVVPCENVATNPETGFVIAPEDYAKAEELGTIECVYHSHINSNEKFSAHDIGVCKQSNLPWLLYSTNTGGFRYADPRGNAPYLGRDWVYGIHDCYSLMRDFYRRELEIVLDDFPRGEEGEWENGTWMMFVNNYEGQGFVEVDRPEKYGDFILMNIVAPTPNHAAVFLPERNCFYHHLMDRQSEVTVWGAAWSRMTYKVLRHESLMQ